MKSNRVRLLNIVVFITLVGSLSIAIIDDEHRGKFMSIATTSLGAYWSLQKPSHDDYPDREDDS